MYFSVNGLKSIFVLVHISRFQQIIGVYTLQASCDNTKVIFVFINSHVNFLNLYVRKA